MKEKFLKEDIKRLNREIAILRKYIYHLQQVVLELVDIDITVAGEDNED